MKIHTAVAAKLTHKGRPAFVAGEYVRMALTERIALEAHNTNETWEIDVMINDAHIHTLDTGIDRHLNDVSQITDAILRTMDVL